MALNRKVKIWLIVLSIPVVLVAAGAIGLKMYFTGARLKSLIIPKIESETGRKAEIRDISFSILPTFSISMEGLKISNKRGMTFDKDEFLSIEHLDLSVKVLDLFKDQLNITHLTIDRPSLYLEVLGDGTSNYSDDKPNEVKDDANVKVTISASGALLLENFEVHNGAVEFIDKKGDSRMVISGYEQKASATKQPAQNAISLTAEATIAKLSYGSMNMWYLYEAPIKAKGMMTFKNEHQTLTLDDVSVLAGELPAKVTGSISNIIMERNFDLTITTVNGEMKQALSLIPPEMLKSAKGLSSSGKVDALITMKGISTDDIQPEVKGTFTIANGTVQYASLPKSITNVNVNGSFLRPKGERKNPPPGNFEISKFSATLGDNPLNGSMKVDDFNDPTVKAFFNGAMNLNEVKQFYPLEQGTELSGVMKGNLSLDGKAKVPASIKAAGAIDFQNATMKTASSKSPVKNLTGTIAFNNQNIESKKLSMMMGESDMSLSFAVKNYLGMVMKDAAGAGKPSATMALTSKQIRTADLMSDEEPASKESGNKGGGAKAPMLLPGMDIDANVNIAKLVTEKFEFTNAKGAVSISNGIVNLKNFSVGAFDGTINTKGSLDMRDPKKRPFLFDLDIKNVQSNSMLSKFTSFGANLFGGLSMTTKLKGELDDTLGLVRSALVGDGGVQVSDGKVVGLPLLASIAAFTGLEELKLLSFNSWSNVFAISNGKVKISDLKIKSGSTDFLVNGFQGLDGSLDYSLNVKLPGSVSDRLKLPGVADQLMQFFKDESGRISLSFLVSGMATSPQLKLDTKPQEEMAKKFLEQKVNEGKNKLEDELKKKLGGGLQDLLKKKKPR